MPLDLRMPAASLKEEIEGKEFGAESKSDRFPAAAAAAGEATFVSGRKIRPCRRHSIKGQSSVT